MTIYLGYARVSTANQTTDNQVATLKKSGCDEVFIDNAVSGSRNHLSSQFQGLMSRVRELRADGESVVVRVTKLDRFSRSMLALLQGLEDLASVGASFESLDGGLNYNPDDHFSKAMIGLLAVLAEFERSLIKSRMAEGMQAKVDAGLLRGRKPMLTQVAVKAIRSSYATGTMTDRKLAAKWNVSRSTIARVLGLYGFEKPYVTLDEWETAKKKATR